MKNNLIRVAIAMACTIPSTLLLAHPAAAQRRDFIFLNSTDSVITGLYISSASDRVWGDNLFNGSLSPGEALTMGNDVTEPDCLHDLRVEYSDGGQDEKSGLDMCLLDAYTIYGNRR
jgi:hypothetical protein